MAPTLRLLYNNSLGTLGESLTDDGTTITFSSAPPFETLSDPQYIPIVLEPASGSPSASFEIVWLTEYTQGQTTGTVLRGQDSTDGVAHDNGVTWSCSPVAADIPILTPTPLSNLPVALNQVWMVDVSTNNTGQALEDVTQGYSPSTDGSSESGVEAFTKINGPGLKLDSSDAGIQVNGEGTSDYYATPAPTTTDCAIRFQVSVNTSDGESGYGVWLRFDPTTISGYMAYVDLAGDVSILRYDDGTSHQLERVSMGSLGTDQFFFRVKGDLLTIGDADQSATLISVTDDTYPDAGHVGLRGVASSSSINGRLTDFSPYNDEGGVPNYTLCEASDQQNLYMYLASIDAWIIAVPSPVEVLGYDADNNFVAPTAITVFTFDQTGFIVTSSQSGAVTVSLRPS